MGWKDAYQYMHGIAEKHGLATDKSAQREDKDLPMGGRIGGLLKMQTSPFVRAMSNGSLIEMPTEANTLICAVSRLDLNLSGELYRFYVATGDDAKKEKFLQVFRDAKGDVTELMYCTHLTRIIPESAEDQDAYMGLSGSGLGDKSYSLWREQLASIGFAETDLALIFGDNESIEYVRDAGDPQSDFVVPFTGTEIRIDDAGGAHGLKQKIYFMPYVREFNGGREYLLITTEIVESQDGDSSKRGIHVDFMIGIPLEQERILMQ